MGEDYRNLLASNLKRFRLERDFTQTKLAESAGVSLACVKKIETGKVERPEAATLTAFASALNVSLADFYRAPKTLSSVRFRAKKSLSRPRRALVVSSCATWLERYCFLEDALGVRSEFKATRPKRTASFDPREYAERFRAELGFAEREPIANVADVLKQCGVKFWFCEERPDPSVFGLAISETPQKTGVVVFTAREISVERRIFSTIHELGHLLLHERSFDARLIEENTDEENEANAFASYFLMPRNEFLKRWRETEGLSFVGRVLTVKRLFRASYQTVLMRLIDEKLADSTVWPQFNFLYGRATGKNLRDYREPSPLNRFDAPPDGFRRLVWEAVLSGEISLSKAAEFLGESVSELRDRVETGENK